MRATRPTHSRCGRSPADGNLTEVAIAVSRAELALQSAVAVRDKVVQAYQDVMRMPI